DKPCTEPICPVDTLSLSIKEFRGSEGGSSGGREGSPDDWRLQKRGGGDIDKNPMRFPSHLTPPGQKYCSRELPSNCGTLPNRQNRTKLRSDVQVGPQRGVPRSGHAPLRSPTLPLVTPCGHVPESASHGQALLPRCQPNIEEEATELHQRKAT